MNSLTYKTDRVVSSAFVDSSIKLGVAEAALLVQDNITECFGALKCDGIIYRELGAYWVYTKARIKILKRPNWKESITTESFPTCSKGVRTLVNTIFKDSKGETVLLASHELCVLNLATHMPTKLSALPFPREGFPETVYDESFEKFAPADYTEVYSELIRSQQIDMSHHLNNTEYVKMALNTFDCKYLEEHPVDTIEMHYLGESREGDTLRILRAEGDGGIFVKIKNGDKDVFEMKIAF